MASEKILVVDDEVEISNLINLYLSKNGFSVVNVYCGIDALNQVKSNNFDLIILDILLPDIDGLELCQQLRRQTNVPIIFLSCKCEDLDKILGFTVGGDDYITKPFSPGVLVARVKAHLRRDRLSNIKHNNENALIEYPGLTINASTHNVHVNDKAVTLSATEFSLLTLLAKNPNIVFSSEQLYDLIWKENNIGDTRTVMVHVSNLRKKIERDPSNPEYIITLKGVGYKFNI